MISAAHRQKRILVSWYCDPVYIRPFTLSDRQVTVGPKIRPDQPLAMFAGFTPQRAYRLKEALISSGLPTVFDAIVVWADASGENLPLQLDEFDCPKVLCVGDTHHCASPLKNMIGYARQAGYDFIVSSHNRQHLHWFAESGFANVAWLPGLKVRHLPRPFQASRKPCISFFGSVGKYHPRRLRLLQDLNRAVPVVAARGSREHAADMCASSLVSFNASLNGDLNLRVFETLSAGGCLLTDRLSAQSGLDLILKEGKDFAGYDSVDECREQARFLIAHPDIALKLAQAGHDAFVATMLPEHRVNQLLSWIFDGALDEMFCSPPPGAGTDASVTDRLQVYEDLQELHRVEEAPRVLFFGDVAEAYLTDALDLRRLRLSMIPPGSGLPHGPDVAGRYTVVDRGQAERIIWDCVIAQDTTALPASIQRHKLLTVPRAG